jgi:hypothetical protein
MRVTPLPTREPELVFASPPPAFSSEIRLDNGINTDSDVRGDAELKYIISVLEDLATDGSTCGAGDGYPTDSAVADGTSTVHTGKVSESSDASGGRTIRGRTAQVQPTRPPLRLVAQVARLMALRDKEQEGGS